MSDTSAGQDHIGFILSKMFVYTTHKIEKTGKV